MFLGIAWPRICTVAFVFSWFLCNMYWEINQSKLACNGFMRVTECYCVSSECVATWMPGHSGNIWYLVLVYWQIYQSKWACNRSVSVTAHSRKGIGRLHILGTCITVIWADQGMVWTYYRRIIHQLFISKQDWKSCKVQLIKSASLELCSVYKLTSLRRSARTPSLRRHNVGKT